MRFKMVSLGKNWQRTDNGLVRTVRPGAWTCFKCFYGEEGKEYAEFFLNIKTVDQKIIEAEIMAKDQAYAKRLIAAFSIAMER